MTRRPTPDDTEALVWAFETEWAAGMRPDLATFLPDPTAPHFAEALRELALVELELATAAGEPRTANDYLARFPALAHDPEAVAALRRQEARAAATAVTGPDPHAHWQDRAARLYAGFRELPSAARAARADSLELADLVLETGGAPAPRFKPGDTAFGFRLVRELGRGAFARVFLAEQTDLAARPVALKIGTRLLDETRALAQLQHSNVVPVYSAHRDGDAHALCMPYLGGTTLADVIADLRRGAPNALWSTLAAFAPSTFVAGTAACAAGARPAPPPAAHKPLPHAKLVAWLGARLADGLAHAHERGVLHRDIKPANVLIADDGTPLLLDFNLSVDVRTRGGAPAALGGTLPYMAAEHLDAFRGGAAPVDERSDIFSLGAVLFEVLTGRLPFAVPKGPLRDQVPLMIAARRAAPPPVPGAPPALRAIVAKCLHPDPAARYQSARALQEDLQRQFDDRPLAHAPEPSLVERGRKFARRNARGLAVACAVALAVALAGAGAYGAQQSRAAARADTENELVGLAGEARALDVLVARGGADDARATDARARAALARFAALDLARLPESETEARRVAARLHLFGAKAATALARCDPSARAELLERAAALAERATEHPDTRAAAHAERVRALAAAGRTAELERARAEALAVPASADPLSAALAARDAGDLAGAARLLEEAARADPARPVLWAARGACSLEQGHCAEAAAHFTTLHALDPQFALALVWRAQARAELNDHPRAEADLTDALAQLPDYEPALVLRGIVRQRAGNAVGAEADLTRTLERGSKVTRIYFVRALARAARGDAAGAAADRATGLRLTPSDEWSWIARGVARQAADPTGALADFAEALKLNPRSREAAQNTAATLSEFLGKPREAVAVLNPLLERCPDFVEARIGRAVLHGRLGDRPAALADVAAALKIDRSPPTLYRAGCALALTAKAHPADAAPAFRYLTEAVLAGTTDDPATDDDLAAVKAHPEYARLLKLAAEVRAKQ
jgi:serine/threonine protein kinase/predicted Zn-dependent protease